MRYDDFMSRAGYETYGSGGSGNSGCGGPVLLIIIGIAFPPVGIILLLIYFISSVSDSIAKSRERRNEKEKRMHELEEKYLTASKALTDKQYDEAIKGFKELGSYNNSETMLARAHDAKKENTYQKAREHFENEEYNEAAAMFSAIQDYRDSTAQLTQIETTKSKIKFEIKGKLLPYTTPGSIVPFGKRKWVVLECSDLESFMISKEGIRMLRPETSEWQRQIMDELSEAERKMVTMSDHGRMKCGKAKSDLQCVSLLSTDDYLRYRDLIPPMEERCEWWLAIESSMYYGLDERYVDRNGNIASGSRGSRQKAVRPVIWVSLAKMLSDPDYEQDKLFAEVKKEKENNQHREVRIGRFSIPRISNHPVQMKWEVLDIREGNSLLLSKEGICLYIKLQGQDANNGYSYFNQLWYNCRLRNWLNGVFFDRCFSECEKEAIIQNHGHNSSDYVFLLSEDDLLHYFDTAATRKCKPSSLVKKQLQMDPHNNMDTVPWLVFGSHENVLSFVNEEGYYSEKEISLWSLDSAISQYGLIGLNSSEATTIKKLVIRPAIWVDLEKLEKLRVEKRLKKTSESCAKVRTKPDERIVLPDLSGGQDKERREQKKQNNDTSLRTKNNSTQTGTSRKKSAATESVISSPQKRETPLPETYGEKKTATAPIINHLIPEKENLVEAGLSIEAADRVEEILLKCQGKESLRMSAYRMIIRLYGQKAGLEIYNKVKPLLNQ